MSHKNVILISLLPPPYGGIAQWTKKLLELAPKYDINFKLVDETNYNERKSFGDHTKRNIFDDLKRTRRIHKDLKKTLKETDENYVVHCCIPSLKFSMIRELYNLKLIKKFKRKYIIHFRSTVSNNVTTNFEKKLLKKILQGADKILLLNQASYDFCNTLYPNIKMEILPNFVDSSESDANHIINKEIKNILYVGMVTPEKGVDDIIEVAKFFPDKSFNLVGRVSNQIEEYYKKNHSNNISFLGPMDKEKIFNYYKNADLFLFLSRFKSEGFSNALCEAMAMGLPCIVTDWAANKEMVIGSSEKAIVESRNVESLKNAINYFESEKVRKYASRVNYLKATQEYSEDVIINRLASIYKLLK